MRYHLDLLDFFRGRHSWRKLQALLDRLPTSSAYREAMLNDPEVAGQIADQPDGPPTPPAWSEYDPHRAALDNLFDLMAELLAATVAAAGGKPPRVPPARRPVTEVDRARRRREEQAHSDLVAEVKAAQERYERNRREG